MSTNRRAVDRGASNIPMDLVGTAHPHKADAQRLLEQCSAERCRLVSDAEVLQEILPRRTLAPAPSMR